MKSSNIVCYKNYCSSRWSIVTQTGSLNGNDLFENRFRPISS